MWLNARSATLTMSDSWVLVQRDCDCDCTGCEHWWPPPPWLSCGISHLSNLVSRPRVEARFVLSRAGPDFWKETLVLCFSYCSFVFALWAPQANCHLIPLYPKKAAIFRDRQNVATQTKNSSTSTRENISENMNCLNSYLLNGFAWKFENEN